MPVEQTYRKILLQDYIAEQLAKGEVVTASDLKVIAEELIDELDLSIPQFNADTYHVPDKEASSASLINDTNSRIKQDLRALYKEMIELSRTSITSFERWNMEAESIEKQLIDLEDRIENLLLLTQDTDGYHSIIVDNFTDTSLVDLSETTVDIDIQNHIVDMKEDSKQLHRLYMENLDLKDDLSFKVRTSVDFISRQDAVGSTLKAPFSQTSASWWTSIIMKRAKPVTCELTVRLIPSGTLPINRITLELHHAAEASPINITPLYSIDNKTFDQLPSITFTQEVRSGAVFAFPEVQAKYIKFLLTKEGADISSGRGQFSYQFGFKSIAFFNQAFDIEASQTLISRPLYVIASDGDPLPFEKLTLETCERIETNTDIKYYVTTGVSEEDVEIDEDTFWVPISPINRPIADFPNILSVGDVTQIDIGDPLSTFGLGSGLLTVSYDGRASDRSNVNPSANFNLVSLDDTDGDPIETPVSTVEQRYTFINPEDRILNYQVKIDEYVGTGEDPLEINETTLQMFRNIGAKSLEDIPAEQVRGIQRGWSFEDPYYSCVVEIRHPGGLSIDVGNSPIYIDDVRLSNKIDASVLSGKTNDSTGLHRISIHKSNWKLVTPGLTTLATLVADDPLYPYNHKLLIEGYDYGSVWDEDEVYVGVDFFAETQVQKVSIFDMLNNIAADDYKKFALDLDVPESHVGGNDPTRVFLVKIDPENPDFQNERFMLRFTLINQLQKYLRIRADFSTTEATVSPSLLSYKVKLG